MNGSGRSKMPYEIRRQKDKHCVFNKDTGKNEGCSDTYEEAVAHQRVLYGVHSGWKPSKKKR